MKDKLKVAQIMVLMLLGLLVVEYSIWIALKPNPLWIAAIGGISVYLTLLWAFLKKDTPGGWLQPIFSFLVRPILATLPRAVMSFVALLFLVGFVGRILWTTWSEEQKEPNYVVELYFGTRSKPAAEALVIVKDLISEKESQERTNGEGYARFKVRERSLYQAAVLIDRNGQPSVARMPVDQDIKFPFLKPIDLNKVAADDWTAFQGKTVPEIDFATVNRESSSLILKTPRGTLVGDTEFLSRHLPWGSLPADVVVSRRPYVVGYDLERRIPRWTAYRMNVLFPLRRRQNHPFVPDPLIDAEKQADLEAYSNNPYDRGNLVSRHDVNGYGMDVEQMVNYMSTIAPQIDKLNRETWSTIERYVLEIYAQKSTDANGLWIIAGPAFIPGPGSAEVIYPVIGGNVAVPTHFFRIIARSDANTSEALAFLVPNTDSVERDISKYLTSVDRIEAVTGLDFFSDLSEEAQNGIESSMPASLWKTH